MSLLDRLRGGDFNTKGCRIKDELILATQPTIHDGPFGPACIQRTPLANIGAPRPVTDADGKIVECNDTGCLFHTQTTAR